jgi:hypothetical protein
MAGLVGRKTFNFNIQKRRKGMVALQSFRFPEYQVNCAIPRVINYRQGKGDIEIHRVPMPDNLLR